jgi:hypothetical protein
MQTFALRMEAASQLTTNVPLDQPSVRRCYQKYNRQHHSTSNRIGATVALAQQICPSAQ